MSRSTAKPHSVQDAWLDTTPEDSAMSVDTTAPSDAKSPASGVGEGADENKIA